MKYNNFDDISKGLIILNNEIQTSLLNKTFEDYYSLYYNNSNKLENYDLYFINKYSYDIIQEILYIDNLKYNLINNINENKSIIDSQIEILLSESNIGNILLDEGALSSIYKTAKNIIKKSAAHSGIEHTKPGTGNIITKKLKKGLLNTVKNKLNIKKQLELVKKNKEKAVLVKNKIFKSTEQLNKIKDEEERLRHKIKMAMDLANKNRNTIGYEPSLYLDRIKDARKKLKFLNKKQNLIKHKIHSLLNTR